ncbi:MAG: MmgE/PrpD family protein [Rhodothalassiaceae bacterium]
MADPQNDTAGNPLLAYGRWIAETPHAWPAEALDSAHREFIDVVAVMVPGAVEPVTGLVYDTVRPWGEGTVTAVGRRQGLSAPWAAMVNGTAGHVLDFDDNFDPPKAHATTVLAPAIFALGEEIGASGAACLDAYIVGLQIMGRVGQGVNPVHRNRGWHATATMGAMGATAACARLHGLGAEQAAMALSLATSMAAGFMSQFGTMAKPIHAGLAAKAGIVAAGLARSGVTAGLGTLDGPTGMNRLMVGPDYEELRDSLTDIEHGQTLRFETEHVGEPLLITEHGFRVKRFANCGSAHRAMDALLHLRAEYGFGADDVARIVVHAPKVHLNNLMYEDPRTGLESKFSMEYALALCLAQGGAGLADFTDEAVMRPEIRRLFPLVERDPVDRLEGVFPTTVEVHLKDGRVVSETRAMPLGSKAAPFSTAQYWEKYESCVAGILSDDEAAALRQALENLPDLAAIGALTRHLAFDAGRAGQ